MRGWGRALREGFPKVIYLLKNKHLRDTQIRQSVWAKGTEVRVSPTSSTRLAVWEFDVAGVEGLSAGKEARSGPVLAHGASRFVIKFGLKPVMECISFLSL